MKHKYALIIATFFVLSLAGCDSLDGNMTPAGNTTINPSDLLIRKWSFPETTVKTDSKSYAVSIKNQPVIGDDNTLTFNKGGTFTYLDGGKTATGQWTLANPKLTLTDADKTTIN